MVGEERAGRGILEVAGEPGEIDKNLHNILQ